MTRSRDPFAFALKHLRRLALDGAYAPGRPIVIVDEARTLKVSTTPVREALAWLCGEGLIERSPSGGYLSPRLEPALVRDRYGFRLLCLTASLDGLEVIRLGETRTSPSPCPEPELAYRMDWWVQSHGNLVLVDAFERVGRLLAPFATAERRLFRDWQHEASHIIALSNAEAAKPLREALVAYHRRRMEAAPLLVLEARHGARGGDD